MKPRCPDRLKTAAYPAPGTAESVTGTQTCPYRYNRTAAGRRHRNADAGGYRNTSTSSQAAEKTLHRQKLQTHCVIRYTNRNPYRSRIQAPEQIRSVIPRTVPQTE
ncbi:MAG: hypothetical protein SPE30_11365 [Candidatus Treponema excrementipullorum]|nr:hypothetical protein [Spirochaetia bacterium]MDD7011360.1 hypothetical protein [Candidatus Treponema excrementipullorum]MDY4466869.1 hypothetical protein [Candidatus Treponema excrementipullorum]